MKKSCFKDSIADENPSHRDNPNLKVNDMIVKHPGPEDQVLFAKINYGPISTRY